MIYRTKPLLFLISIIPAVLLWHGGHARADDVTVFAAASLREALDDLASRYTSATGTTITASYAGSATLARQIEALAPADVFISANTAWMDQLESGHYIDPSSRVDLLGNALVLIGRAGETPAIDLASDTALAEALGSGKLAMALIDAVPAGIYGKEALDKLGLWENVSDAVAQTDNVRAALALVALGAAPLGVVYETDAKAEARVEILARFPDHSHDPITYPAALTSNAAIEPAQAFLDYLQSETADKVFESYGFSIPAEK